MKATGIVRRIDGLGRIVIPKEIRRSLRIREGESMEILVSSDGEIILTKNSPAQGIEPLAGGICRGTGGTDQSHGLCL